MGTVELQVLTTSSGVTGSLTCDIANLVHGTHCPTSISKACILRMHKLSPGLKWLAQSFSGLTEPLHEVTCRCTTFRRHPQQSKSQKQTRVEIAIVYARQKLPDCRVRALFLTLIKHNAVTAASVTVRTLITHGNNQLHQSCSHQFILMTLHSIFARHTASCVTHAVHAT